MTADNAHDRLPQPEHIEQVLVDIVRNRQPIGTDELERLAAGAVLTAVAPGATA